MKLRILSLFNLCCALLAAWPAPERVTIDHHTYTLLRYILTPSQVQSYHAHASTPQWWGTLRELDPNVPYASRNIIGTIIPTYLSHAPAREAALWLLHRKQHRLD